jgi:hypothetical protein
MTAINGTVDPGFLPGRRRVAANFAAQALEGGEPASCWTRRPDGEC